MNKFKKEMFIKGYTKILEYKSFDIYQRAQDNLFYVYKNKKQIFVTYSRLSAKNKISRILKKGVK